MNEERQPSAQPTQSALHLTSQEFEDQPEATTKQELVTETYLISRVDEL